MKLLLDTHAFLWFILGDGKLSSAARSRIADPINEIMISPASYWEIAIKISLGKYSLGQPFQAFIEKQIAVNQFRVLAIEPKHAAALIGLPHHHRDPFDRLLVAQAIVEGLPIVSTDLLLDSYPIRRLW